MVESVSRTAQVTTSVKCSPTRTALALVRRQQRIRSDGATSESVDWSSRASPELTTTGLKSASDPRAATMASQASANRRASGAPRRGAADVR